MIHFYHINVYSLLGPVNFEYTRTDLFHAILHAGEELDLVYSHYQLPRPSPLVNRLINLIISKLRKILMHVIRTDVWVVDKVLLIPNGVIYVRNETCKSGIAY